MKPTLPTLYLSDLVRRRGALFAEFITNADLSRLIVYTFKGGRQERETTAPCQLIRPDQEQRPGRADELLYPELRARP